MSSSSFSTVTMLIIDMTGQSWASCELDEKANDWLRQHL